MTENLSLQKILLLGDPRLYQPCQMVEWEEIEMFGETIDTMARLVKLFKATYGKGRAIAAPQIGVMKQLIVLNIDQPQPIFNPQLEFPNDDTFELWDDCMSFPRLLIKVKRYKNCILTFKNAKWETEVWHLQGDMSELIQHECDHLEGILATMRAVDVHSFRMMPANKNES